MSRIKGSFIDETGNEYGNFKVLERDLTCDIPIKWICRCVKCKEFKSVSGTTLRFGNGKSCKCTKRKVSVDTRKNKVNDNFFGAVNLLNSYWAGFIAADGYVTGNLLGIQLGKKDLNQLINIKKDLCSTTKIETEVRKTITYKFRMRSVKIVEDLKRNFKIVPKKSLILEYPKFTDKNFEDAFITGYIDGDGSIGELSTKSILQLRISILGTEKFLQSVKKRFEEILNKSSGNLVQTNNIFKLTVYAKDARNLFKHFYNVNIPKLERKWKKEYYKRILEENKL